MTRRKQKKLIRELIEYPENSIHYLDLIYTQDQHLTIKRIKEGDHFVYKNESSAAVSSEDIERLEGLVIPPKWKEVLICSKRNGHLQAVGRDEKGRKQYIYHELWRKIRNQTKFYQLAEFGKALPAIRKQVDADLDQKKWNKAKVLALAIRLMEETHIRVGNNQYAKRNKTYGLTTLRNRHVLVSKDKLKFKFIGKRGKKHELTLKNKRLIHLVNQCEEIPGWELFQFYDEDGFKQTIKSDMVNEYIRNTVNENFTAKNFRTWAGTIIFFEYLLDKGFVESDKEREKNLIEAYDEAAINLGNTRAVCRKYYVHPAVAENYSDGSIKPYFKKVDSIKSKEFQTASEQSLILMLENYTPSFLE